MPKLQNDPMMNNASALSSVFIIVPELASILIKLVLATRDTNTFYKIFRKFLQSRNYFIRTLYDMYNGG